MIDILKDFGRHQKKVYDYCRQRIDGYYSSQCYKILRRRMNVLDRSIDLKTNKSESTAMANEWMSKTVATYGHEVYLMTRSVLNKNFSAEPLISFEPNHGMTTWEQAANAQETLAQNFKSTMFRAKVMRMKHKSLARYGSAVTVSFFNDSRQTVKRTQETMMGIGQVASEVKRQNVLNVCVDIANYFQNPEVADSDESDFQGFIQRWHLSRLINTAKAMPDLYIKENLKKAIEEAKENASTNYNYRGTSISDWNKFGVDIEHWYGKLNIAGNEDDETIYYLEIVGDNIIRIQDNPFDWNIKPITITTMDKRQEYWWGNTPVEKIIPAENFAQITMAMTADATWKALQSFLFYPEGGLDVSAINDRAKNGGFIPVDPEILENYKTPIFPWQRQEISTAAIQYMMAEAKETMQRVNPKTDLGRKGLPGGIQNDTAYAANLMENQASDMQMDYLGEVADGYKQIGRINHIMLVQFADDEFEIRSGKEGVKKLHKRDIMGDFMFTAKSSLTKNTQMELAKHENAVTWLMNLVNTGNPQFQGINMRKIIKKVAEKFDLEMDTDEIIPDQQPQQQGFTGMMESAQGINPMTQAMAGQGMAVAA